MSLEAFASRLLFLLRFWFCEDEDGAAGAAGADAAAGDAAGVDAGAAAPAAAPAAAAVEMSSNFGRFWSRVVG